MVSNIISESGNAVRNQFVISAAGGRYFQSYSSVVVRIDNSGKVTLGRDWDYSTTTSKYVYKFLRDNTRFQVHSRVDVRKLIDNGVFKEESRNLTIE